VCVWPIIIFGKYLHSQKKNVHNAIQPSIELDNKKKTPKILSLILPIDSCNGNLTGGYILYLFVYMESFRLPSTDFAFFDNKPILLLAKIHNFLFVAVVVAGATNFLTTDLFLFDKIKHHKFCSTIIYREKEERSNKKPTNSVCIHKQSLKLFVLRFKQNVVAIK
jgi:hypothetical protein